MDRMKCRRLCAFGNFRPLRSCLSPRAHPGPAFGPVADLRRPCGASGSSTGSACPSPVPCRRGPGPPAAHACGPGADPGGPREPAAGGRAARHRPAARGQPPRRRHPGVHHRQCHLRGLRAAERFFGTCGPFGVQESFSPTIALGPAGLSVGEPSVVCCLLRGPPPRCVPHCGQWRPPSYCRLPPRTAGSFGTAGPGVWTC